MAETLRVGAKVIVTESRNWVARLFGVPPLRHTHFTPNVTSAVQLKEELEEVAPEHGMKIKTEVQVVGRDN